MAIDHAMFDLAEETGALVWRLYRWDPFCLSFGRHEPAARRYDRAKIQALHLDTVRRPTGGRAVWHARELTYAVAAPAGPLGSLRAAYRAIHETLATAVRQLGSRATLASDRPVQGIGSGACFAAPVGGEVVVNSKKVIGSAQLRGQTALLQHGSLLLEDDQSLVRSLQIGLNLQESSEATLSALAERPIHFDEAAAAVAGAVAATGLGPIDPQGPNEVLRRARLHYDTYQSEQWTWER